MRKINQSLVLGISSILAFVAATSHVSAQTCTLATPTAEGAGRCTTGGRGGDVKIVTSLAASGAGTLADAITTAPSAGRIIVFAKSGVIDLTTTDASGNPTGGAIYVNNSNITIAGQTAPGEGITITGGKLMVRGSNVILEHIRSRRGFIRADVDHGDAISIEPATGVTQSNIFVEHVSASWGTDENLSLADAGAATLQWNLIAEGLNYSNAASNPTNHGYGSIWAGHGGTEASFFHTLYAHNNRRNPHIGNYTGSGSPTMDFRNNVVYDWQDFASHNNGGATYNINFVNNYYKSGPSSLTANTVFTFDTPSTNTKMYSSGNLLNGSAASEATNFAFPAGTTWSTFQNSTAFASSAYTTIAAAQNYSDVLAQSGTTLPARDLVDVRIINEVTSGGGHVVNKETEVTSSNWKSTYYESITKPADADNDGLPDFWEGQFGSVTLNNNGTGSNVDNDNDAYVNIEEYINNTIPITISTAGGTPKTNVAYVGSMDSRAKYGAQPEGGTWRIYRSGPTSSALVVRFRLSSLTDFTISSTATLAVPTATSDGYVIIPAGWKWADIVMTPASTGTEKQVILELATEGFVANPSNYVTASGGSSQYPYFVGCPSSALIKVK